MRGSLRARLLVPTAAAVMLTALAGCTSDPVGSTVRPSERPSASRTVPIPTPTTPPPTQRAADATPLSATCADLVPDAVAAQLLPSLTPVADWTPQAGSAAARLTELKGTACAWRSPAGDLLEVAVAKPSRADAIALKNDMVRRSNAVPTYGGEAYFQTVDHVGEVDAFRGRTWVLARSNRFFEPGDAIGVIGSVDEDLGLRSSASAAPTDSPSPSATP